MILRVPVGIVALGAVLTGCLALTQHDGPWPCTSDSDCSGGYTCRHLSSGTSICAPPDYCQGFDDCNMVATAVPLQCVGNHCVPPPCYSDAECSPYRCNMTCNTTCTTAAECLVGYVCANGSCVQPPCTSDAQCGNYLCKSGSCLISCVTDSECAAGSLCNLTNSTCAPRPCKTGVAGQCDGFACVGGVCGTSCSGSSGCDPGLACSGSSCSCDSTPGACGGYACVSNACLTSCTSDSDCDSTHTCNSGQCVTCTGTALDCSSQSGCAVPGCAMGMVCNGGAIDCHAYDHASGTCGGIVGCSYDLSAIQCVGNATCGGQSSFSCYSEFGCSPGTACTGTPTPCGQLSASQCTGTLGCQLQ